MRSIVSKVRAFWREIEPGIHVDRDNSIERWDACGEGRATSVTFEGFGVTGFIFIGLTPRRRRGA